VTRIADARRHSPSSQALLLAVRHQIARQGLKGSLASALYPPAERSVGIAASLSEGQTNVGATSERSMRRLWRLYYLLASTNMHLRSNVHPVDAKSPAVWGVTL
jgi:hypothetical protein